MENFISCATADVFPVEQTGSVYANYELRQRVAFMYPVYSELPAASEDYISLDELCGAAYGSNVRGGGLGLTENELRNLIEHDYLPRPLFHRNGVEYWDTDELEAYLFEWFVPFTHEQIKGGQDL